MPKTVSSHHLRGASEVLLLPKILPGFVDNSELVLSYTSRLKALLTTLFELRRVATDLGTDDLAGPIERLQTVYDVQWTVLEEERTLLVAASFDRSWEDYFRLLFDLTGPLLDAIFMHCVGYRDFEGSFEGFTAWVRDTQRECNLFYLANADFTTDDGRSFRRLLVEPETERASLHIRPPVAPGIPPEQQLDRAQDLARALQALYGLRKLFPATEQLCGGQRTAEAVFDSAMGGVFYSQRERVRELVGAKALPLQANEWAAKLIDAESHRLQKRRPKPGSKRQLPLSSLENIQGGILRDYAGLAEQGAAVLIRCETPAIWSAFLQYAIQHVTKESTQLAPGEMRWNVTLTYGGLERLGLSDDELQAFPAEFRDGMEKRAGLLGDLDDTKYPRDTWPLRRGSSNERVPLAVVDALVLLQRKTNDMNDRTTLNAKIEELERLGVDVLFVQPLFRQLETVQGVTVDREPFGFVEGHPQVSSQPAPNAVLETAAGSIDLTSGVVERDVIPLGEILLGYEDQHGQLRPRVDPSKLFADSTFLVVRKLEQKVNAFEKYVSTLRDQTGPDGKATHVAPAEAWIMGRTTEGEPLAKTHSKRPNDFDYSHDAGHCPYFAHIRRANPREPGTPRIVRRRFTFADEGPSEVRGTFFMAYNASIAGQFEVIQRWINGGNRTGLLSAQRDILAGQSTALRTSYGISQANGGSSSFDAPTEPMVRLHWGLYLFVPAVAALRQLQGIADKREHGARWAVDTTEVKEGEQLIEQLLRLATCTQMSLPGGTTKPENDTERAFRDECKQLIEEPLNHERTAKVWSAIRKSHGGVLNVPGFGVLVGSAKAAAEVLSNRGDSYSVHGYVGPMGKTIGNPI